MKVRKLVWKKVDFRTRSKLMANGFGLTSQYYVIFEGRASVEWDDGEFRKSSFIGHFTSDKEAKEACQKHFEAFALEVMKEFE